MNLLMVQSTYHCDVFVTTAYMQVTYSGMSIYCVTVCLTPNSMHTLFK